MDDTLSTPPDHPGPRRRRLLYAGGLLAAGTLAGGILAGTMSASAADTSSTASPSTAATAPSQPAPGDGQRPGQPPAGGGGAAPVRSDEKSLSTADTATVKAAALKAVPGGTVYRVETDAGDGTYEAHMKKADGTPVTVKLDSSFSVTKVEAGMGAGDPAPAQGSGTSTP